MMLKIPLWIEISKHGRQSGAARFGNPVEYYHRSGNIEYDWANIFTQVG